jgi:hypothetical protein
MNRNFGLPKKLGYLIFFFKLPKENSRPIGENPPNQVTLSLRPLSATGQNIWQRKELSFSFKIKATRPRRHLRSG